MFVWNILNTDKIRSKFQHFKFQVTNKMTSIVYSEEYVRI